MSGGPPEGQERVKELLAAVAGARITLESLSPADLELVARSVSFDTLKAAASRGMALAGADWADLTQRWLDPGRRAASTVRAYRSALAKFGAWCASAGAEPLDLTPAQADDFIKHLMLAPGSPAYIRLTCEAVSSLYSWLSRSDYPVRNPFLGTRAKPGLAPRRSGVFLTPALVQSIIGALSPRDALAAGLLAWAGVPLSALPSLVTRFGNFEAQQRGLKITGQLSGQVMGLLESSGLMMPQPFAGSSAPALSKRLQKVLSRLAARKAVPPGISARDFSEFYVREYWAQSRDLYALRLRLGHSSAAVTEKLLARMGLK